MPNPLAQASSPYLRQHADNPVAWLPWGEEAFARARAEDKPVFLSIGYATCHWCHVMAHESFESTEIAELLNRNFICIKVDREERPDVDRVYMTYVQALSGRGGWPLSVFLTPELKPFFGGTYFPPEDVQGRPGFPSILSAIAGSWKARREELLQEGRRITGLLALPPSGAGMPPAGSPEEGFLGLLERSWSAAWSYFNESFDATSGGFGGAPKFPQPSNLFFLLRLSLAHDDPGLRDEARRMVTHTLSMMARGGVHDHVGGGFHRYSVDDSWFVPHFEKMLYDQGQLAALCLEAWQADGDGRLAWLARDILTYVLRDLRDPSGAFYAAEDADSPVDRAPGATRREGAFYVWRASELRELLGDDHALAVSLFSIQEAGNVPPGLDPHGEMTDRNVLHQPAPLAEIAARAGLSPAQAVAARLRILDTLLHARGCRPRPLRDGKVVAAWNGLMLSALSRGALCTDGSFAAEWTGLPAFAPSAPSAPAASQAPAASPAAPGGQIPASTSARIPSQVYPDSGYALCLRAAGEAAAALRTLLWDPAARRLHRSYCEGQRGPLAVSEDYACLVQGLLDLYEAGLDPQWLLFARELQSVLDELFWDEAAGGYFCSSSEAGDLILRLKDEYDGAEPSASCVSARNLHRLSAFLDQPSYRQRAERTLASLRPRLEKHPQALPGGLCALEWAAAWPPRLVVLSGERSDPRLLAAARAHWREPGPPRVLLAVGPSGFGAELCEGRPWLAEIAARARPGEVLRYVCDNGACSAPEPAPLL